MYKNYSFDKTGKVMTLQKLQENQFSVSKFHSQKGGQSSTRNKSYTPLNLNNDFVADYKQAQQSPHSISSRTMNSQSPKHQFNFSDGFSLFSKHNNNQSSRYLQTIRKTKETLLCMQQNNIGHFGNSYLQDCNPKHSHQNSLTDKSGMTSYMNGNPTKKISLDKPTQQIFQFHEKKEVEEKEKLQLIKDIKFLQKQIADENKSLKEFNNSNTFLYQQKQKIDEQTKIYSEQLYPLKKEKLVFNQSNNKMSQHIYDIQVQNEDILLQIEKEKEQIASLKEQISQQRGVSIFQQKNNIKIKNDFYYQQKVVANCIQKQRMLHQHKQVFHNYKQEDQTQVIAHQTNYYTTKDVK